MGKVKNFAALNIRKLTGGKDPVRLVEEFIMRQGFDPAESAKEKNADNARWLVALGKGEDLEILVEGVKQASETTIYMGVNVCVVPLRNSTDVLVAALEIADGLVGIKVSLVGHFLVLSATLGAAGTTIEDLEYHFKLIEAQESWFRDALADELGWQSLTSE